MKSAQQSLWHVVPIVAIVGLFIFASRTGGPSPAVSASLSATAAPEVKMYLRVDGVQGEFTDDLHKGCLEVLSYEQEATIWGDPHVSEGGSKNFRLTVTRPVNKATPALYLQYCKQTAIPTVTLELWREGGATSQKMMVYTHHECALNAIRNMKSVAAGDPPTEELTFICTGTDWAYTEYDANGKLKAEIRTQWDGRTGK